MTTKVIEYKSDQKPMDKSAVLFQTGEKDGIKYIWRGSVEATKAIFKWMFDWEDLEKQGVNRLVGHLIVKSVYGTWNSQRVDIDWTETNQSVVAMIDNVYSASTVFFEYNLTAHYSEKPLLEKNSLAEMFAASDKTDVALIVEGKQMHFLSIHSDYFSSLFSSNFEEGQTKEIEVKEVSYEDFVLLLSTIYPMKVFPNDKTAEKLLELANRFLMPYVKQLVEHHLLEHSKLENEKMIMLGDQYGIKSILEKTINQTNTVEKMKKLEMSPEYAKLSSDTIAKLFKRLLQVA
ncbi:hypothetical protein B9Z55_016178 [Caenorhabditis nigoni]|uniref:BTB domain-containing protein n=1 Tax=Caenorhabditis nigoni TaxID=1611254 RepID=A0A2G5UDI2_9PELO|nr:hypothetical protein B9Z55_016178 [Caenorhabditis nigoni]